MTWTRRSLILPSTTQLRSAAALTLLTVLSLKTAPSASRLILSVTFVLHLCYVLVTFAGDDVDKKKPDPTIYNVAAQRLGVDPADCVVVEDSIIGLKAALGAGMRCIITYTPSTKQQVGGDHHMLIDGCTLCRHTCSAAALRMHVRPARRFL
jgi:beta-phosphoglucomutase-like phosphatase (HAD superfamily)